MGRTLRRLRAAVPTIAYVVGLPAATYGFARSWDGHLADGLLLIVAGAVLCVPRRAEVARAERRRREDLLLLCVRVRPGHTAGWIGQELNWRPGRLYPMLDRLVEAGQLHREPDNTYWTMAAPAYDPNWAAKKEAS